MKLLILAAGYATRLYPLTLTQPKPLLPVAGKPMVDHVLDNLAGLPGLDRVLIVTNNKCAPHFQRWAEAYQKSKAKLEFTVVNDGSTSDADKLGAIGDIQFVIERERIDDDLVVVAGDNLFSQPLTEFGSFCKRHDEVVLGVHDVGSLDEARKYGVVAVDSGERVTSFVEKPSSPPSTTIGIALYYYPRRHLGLVKQYIAEGNNPDQPGRLIQWIYPRQPVLSWRIPGIWYDIGSKETLEEANRLFARL